MLMYAWKNPYYNWDLLAYTAASYSVEEHDPAALHAKSYETVRKEIPDSNYRLLVSAENPYRRETASNPMFFIGQIPLYRIRPLYVAVIYGLGKLGISAVEATRAISIVSAAVIILLVGAWVARQGPAGSVAGCLTLVAAGVFEGARLSTPDALSAAIVLAAFYLLVKGFSKASRALLLVSLLTRPDNLLLLAIWSTYACFITRGFSISRAEYFFLLGTGTAVYLAITYFFGTLSLKTVLPLPGIDAVASPAIFLKNYCYALGRGLWGALVNESSLLLFLILGLLGGTAAGWGRSAGLRLGSIALSTVILHFLLFPAAANRFYIAPYTLIGMVFFRTFWEKAPEREFGF